MKCLALWQPWASLIVIGAKRFETRSWSTTYRGPLLIHAAKKWDQSLLETCKDAPFCYALKDAVPFLGDIPRGCILGVADLVECWMCDTIALIGSDAYSISLPTGNELAFGDFAQHRFAWQLENVRRFPNPIPYTGHQGIFNVDDDLVAEQMDKAVLV